MYKIQSPIPDVTAVSTFGGVTLSFQDGSATAAELPDGVLAYMAANGYTVTGTTPAGASDTTPAGAVERPARNGSTEAWQAYARTQGATDADLEGKTRDDLVAAYGGEG